MKTAAAKPDAQNWNIVPYDGETPFKKVRIRDEANLDRILAHLRSHDYVVLLGPPYSEKTALLRDVIAGLRSSGLAQPIYIDLWQARTDDEPTFFTSLARLISQDLNNRPLALSVSLQDARSFQNFLLDSLPVFGRHLALLFDHLHALPDDLVHSLLLSLRAIHNERGLENGAQVTVLVTGGTNLANFSSGPTSPFNIAKAVRVKPLDPEQSRSLAIHAWQAWGRSATEGATAELLKWASGDHYLLPLLCGWSAEAVEGYQRPVVTRAAVRRAAQRLWLTDEAQASIREAIRIIEEDSGTLLDVLHLIEKSSLAKSSAHQSITPTGVTRLQLCGAAELVNGRYRIKNGAFHEALRRHFQPERVSQVLRMTGRWREAIDYLAPRLQSQPLGSARADLLEAIIQSIYAATGMRDAYRGLIEGLQLGFGLKEISIYWADQAQNELRLVPLQPGVSSRPAVLRLDDPECVEAHTFRYPDFALRKSAEDWQLFAALIPEQRPFGVVRVDKYAPVTERQSDLEDLPEVRRFLRHAAVALDNVRVRSAYQEIGQAVLDAKQAQPTLERVLTSVTDALGCDYAALYLLDSDGQWLNMEAGVGRAWQPDWRRLGHFDRGSAHPAATCLDGMEIVAVTGTDSRLHRTIVDRFHLHQHLCIFMPLLAAGEELGTLELGFPARTKSSLDEEARRNLIAFANQVAVAVYNVRLLRQTDEALARRVREMEKLRDINLTLGETLDLDTVLERVVHHVRELFPGTEATIWRYHKDDEKLTVLYTSVADPAYRTVCHDMRCPAGQAILHEKVVTVPDLAVLADSPFYAHAVQAGWHSMIAMPLKSHEWILGALDIYMVTAEAVPPEAEGVLTAFAAQAAVAIDNAQQYLALEQARRALEAARERDMTDLANTLFHRIRNAVGDIPYHLDTIRERADTSGDLEEPIKHIKDRVRSLKALSEALRTLVDEPEGFGETVEVLEFLDETVRRTIRGHAVEWQLKAPPTALKLYGHRTLLSDAVQSLVENACEAMDWHGTITLHVARPAVHKIELRISDTGPGIPQDIQDRIFELGYTTKDDPYREHGRGLFTCKIIVQKHRGTITFDSQPGQGTTFIITLPAPEEEPIPTQSRSDHETARWPTTIE